MSNGNISLRHELCLSEAARSPGAGLLPVNLPQLSGVNGGPRRQDSFKSSSCDGVSSRMKTLLTKIEDLKCPYLDGMSLEMVKGVVFRPGEARTRLLTWMTSRISPSATNIAVSSSGSISSVPRLASLLADMGLCAREDFELIKGTGGPTPKQVLFLEALVGVVTLSVLQQERLNTSIGDKMQSVPWQMERCCHFVDDLCRHHQLAEVFPSSVSLIPPALAVTVDQGGVVMQDPQSFPSPPSLSDLSSRCEEVKRQLQKHVTELDNLKQTGSYAEIRSDTLATCHKMMGVSLGTLAQLATAFCHTYEAELQPWTNTGMPKLSGLGQLCVRVELLKENLDKLFDALAVLERSYRHIGKLADVPLENRDRLTRDAYDTLKETLAVFKDVKLTES